MPCRQEFPDDHRIQPSLPQPEDVDFDALVEALQSGADADKREAIAANDRDAKIARDQQETARNEALGKLSTEDLL